MSDYLQIAKEALSEERYSSAFEAAQKVVKEDGKNYDAFMVGTKALLAMSNSKSGLRMNKLIEFGYNLVSLRKNYSKERGELCLSIIDKCIDGYSSTIEKTNKFLSGETDNMPELPFSDSYLYNIEYFLTQDTKAKKKVAEIRRLKKEYDVLLKKAKKKDFELSNTKHNRLQVKSIQNNTTPKEDLTTPDICINYYDGNKGYTHLKYNIGAKTIIINDWTYKFSEIIGFSCTSIGGIQISGETTTSKANAGSVVGRTIVGGLLGGVAGAIIGGATAKRTTTRKPAQYSSISYSIKVIASNNIHQEILLTIDAEEAKQQIIPVLAMIKNMK